MQQYEIVKIVAQSGGGVAVITVVDLHGSAPRHLGAKMAVLGEGQAIGTVGGGAVESRAVESARACIEHRRPGGLCVEMTGAQALGAEPICGGTVDLAIEYVADPSFYVAAAERLERGERVVLVSENAQDRGGGGGNARNAGSSGPSVSGGLSLQPPRGCLAVLDSRGKLASGASVDFDGVAVSAVLASGVPETSARDGLFYEPVEPPERLLILGGGHVGLALARFALELGFRVCVGDSRPEFADPGRFPAGVETRCGNFADIVKEYPFGASTYAVVVSPNHAGDLESVRAILGREYRYAGFIGSRRKTRMIMDQVLSEGFDPAKVEALRAPIGADIGAETPEEIAVSILAEIVAVRRNSPAAAVMDAQRARRRA